VVEVFRLHSVKEAFLVWWFNKFSDSARRKRLHGWRMWHDYCVENNYEPSDMSKLLNPAVVVADFVASLQMVDIQIYLIKEAVTKESDSIKGESDIGGGFVSSQHWC
jgi:hypothetical protein